METDQSSKDNATRGGTIDPAAGFERELEAAKRIAREAGRILLEVYAGEFDVEEKPEGGGPVTVADARANAFIVEQLRQAFPDDGVVSEEDADTSDARRYDRCWYVDPLDGTREFVNRNGEFAVHVGLAVDGAAKVGVVYRPVGERLYAGVVGGRCLLEADGAVNELRVSSVTRADEVRLLVSRSHRSRATDQIRAELGIASFVPSGSVGLKCGLLAESKGDLYIHTSPKSYRWDACAPEAIVRAAGGVFTDLAGQAYNYDGSELQNHRGLLASNPALLERVLPIIRKHARDRGLI